MHRFPSVVIVLCLLGMAALAVFMPYTHNPDADFYYGVTLRVLRGDFLSSVDGLYSPLLSWLMAAVAACGLSLPASYRLVSLLGFGLLMWSSFAVFRLLRIPSRLSSALLIIVFICAIKNTVFVVTSDILVAGGLVLFFVLTLKVRKPSLFQCLLLSTLGAACYYAKNICLLLIPVVLISLAIVRVFTKEASFMAEARRLTLILVPFFLVALPWIFLISMKYGDVLISGQQLVMSKQVLLRDYHPDLDQYYFQHGLRQAQGHADRGANKSLTAIVLKASGNVRRGILVLMPELLDRQFGPIFFAVLLFFGSYACLKLRNAGESRMMVIETSVIVLSYGLLYLLIWGGRFRYYLALIPFILALYALGVRAFDKQSSGAYCWLGRPLLFLLHVVGILQFLFLSAPVFTRPNDNKAMLNHLVNLPILSGNAGPMTGRVFDELSGLAAVLLKREMWNTIDPAIDSDSSQLNKKLRLWNVQQILWTGAPYDLLAQLDCFSLTHEEEFSGTRVSIFERTPSCA